MNDDAHEILNLAMDHFLKAGADVYVSGGEVKIELTQAQFNVAIDAVVTEVRDQLADAKLKLTEAIKFDPSGLDEASYRQGYADSAFTSAGQVPAMIKRWHQDGRRSVARDIREHARTAGSMHPCDHFVVGLQCAAKIAEGTTD